MWIVCSALKAPGSGRVTGFPLSGGSPARRPYCAGFDGCDRTLRQITEPALPPAHWPEGETFNSSGFPSP